MSHDTPRLLDDAELTRQLADLPGVARGAIGTIVVAVRAPSFEEAVQLVRLVAEDAERMDHHPDIDLRWGRVVLAVASHDVGGITDRDLRLARAVSAIVADHGGTVEHPSLSAVEIAIDTMDSARIRPFWEAVLGFAVDGPDAVSDRQARLPSIWFQQLDEPRPVRGRIHLDVTVPHDVAEERVAAAVAAGGTLVSDTSAPRFWVLADADGNEACVCTWQGREG